jgi:hypothetical protein
MGESRNAPPDATIVLYIGYLIQLSKIAAMRNATDSIAAEEYRLNRLPT